MRALIALTVTVVVLGAACGGDDDDAETTAAAEAATTVAAATAGPSSAAPATDDAAAATTARDTTEAPEATATPAATPGTSDGFNDQLGTDPDSDAAAMAWLTAFDSSVPFEGKAAVIADAEALRPTIDAYTAVGQQMGGITLVPSDVTITGDVATIVYDIDFAGQQAYGDQTGAVERVDGAWMVSRDQFCAFMALARNACPA